ncbi:mechanosensitive ion channel domain-containing protein [Sulfurimonas sp.]|nr:mechanosensitive ion channel domain-containing protein [Sulfurimonas sp.]
MLTKYTDAVVVYASEYGLKIVAAVAIFYIGKIVVKRVTNVFKRLMNKAHVDDTLVKFLGNLIYFSLLIVVILASLNALGVNTTSFLAVFGAASLAVGLALKDSLSNIGAAVIVIIFRPFDVGDAVDVAGVHGMVEEINLFSTTIITPDNKIVMIPNSAVIASNIVNYSKKPTRRIEHKLLIDYGDNLKVAKDVLMKLMQDEEKVLAEPAPFVAVSELGDNGVELVLRVWVNNADYWDVYFAILEEAKLAFDENKISVPFPQMDVTIKNKN